MQDVAFVAVDDGMPGVVAALAAHDDLRRPGQHVDDLALPFVAPLRSHENDVGHRLKLKNGAAWKRDSQD